MLTKWGISDARDLRFALHLGCDTDQKYPSLSSRSTASVEKYANLDSKNPTRWHKALQVKTVGSPGKVPLKDAILQKCEERNDEVSQVVHLRLSSISDLHAADAQYHKDCFQKFFSVRNI